MFDTPRTYIVVFPLIDYTEVIGMYNEKSKVEKYEEVIHRRNNKYITSASIWMTGV